MRRNFAQKTYDVFVADGDRWLIDRQFDVRSAAEERAQELLSDNSVYGVRVTAENHRTGDEEIIFEEAVEQTDRPIKISPIEDAAPCDTLVDALAFSGRRTVGRLLRQYLDYRGITALEMAFDLGALQAFERNEKLMSAAMQRIGTIQARDLGLRPAERVDALYTLFSEIKSSAQAAALDGRRGDMMADGGLGAVVRRAPANEPARTLYILSAMANALSGHADWADKLAFVLKSFENPVDEEVLAYLDGVVAEILDGPEAVTAVFGGFGDSVTAFCALVHITQGRCHIEHAHASLATLNEVMARHDMSMTKATLMSRVAVSLGGVRPLTREGGPVEIDAFKTFISDLAEDSGLAGGRDISAATVARARIVFAKDENLSIPEAAEQIAALLPHRAVRLGFLLDLISTSLGQTCEKEILAILARYLRQITSLASLVPEGTSPTEARAIVTALSNKLQSDDLPEKTRALFTKTLGSLKTASTSTSDASPGPVPKNKTTVSPNGITRRVAKSGEILFEEGEAADVAYLIIEGTVDVFRKVGDTEKVLATLGKGEVLGEMSLIDNQPRMASARITADTKLSVITQDDLSKRLDRLGADDMVLRRLIDVFVGRLRGQSRLME